MPPKKTSKKTKDAHVPTPLSNEENALAKTMVPEKTDTVDLTRHWAYTLSQQQKTYDDWVWLLAEARLLVTTNMTPGSPPVTEDAIRDLASKIAGEGLRIDQLQWELAEKRIILQGMNVKVVW